MNKPTLTTQPCPHLNLHFIAVLLASILACLCLCGPLLGCATPSTDGGATAQQQVQQEGASSTEDSANASADENSSDTQTGKPAGDQEAQTSQGEQAGETSPQEKTQANSEASDNSAVAAQEAENAPNANGSTLTVRFIDVGQGDAALIDCDDQWMLIDGGDAHSSSTMYAILQRLNVSHLTYAIATHPDADHIGGISGALNYASCGQFFCSTTTSTTKTYDNLLRYLQERSGIGVTVPNAGDTLYLGAAQVTFLGPVEQGSSDNNNSLVVRISLGNHSFLFAGDAETEEELSLVSAGVKLDADVIKVGHHGSANSSNLKFLEKVAPQYAIISVGKNDYGHPTTQALSNLAAVGATVMRTDERGDITFTTDGTNLSVTTAKGN